MRNIIVISLILFNTIQFSYAQCDFRKNEEAITTEIEKVVDYGYKEHGIVRVSSQAYALIREDGGYGSIRLVIILDSNKQIGLEASDLTFMSDDNPNTLKTPFMSETIKETKRRVVKRSIYKVKGVVGRGTFSISYKEVKAVEIFIQGNSNIDIEKNVSVIIDQINCISSITR